MDSNFDFKFPRSSVPFKPAKIGSGQKRCGDGHIRTLPELIEYNARVNPEHIFCVQARKEKEGESNKSEFLTINHLQLRQAISNCSKWLVQNVGELSRPRGDESGVVRKGSPIALLMESDVGILFHLFSSSAVLASPALNKSASEALALLNPTGDKPLALYISKPYDSFIGGEPVISVRSLWDPDPNHYIDEWDRNVIVLHSSGTTGLPKAMCTSHEYWLGYATCHDFRNVEEASGLSTTTLPLYHGFGLHSPAISLSMGHTMVIPPSSAIPTGYSTVELLALTQAKSLITVPMILEEISLLPENKGVDALLTLNYVAFGGGPLKRSVGEKLAMAGVKLLKVYGLTETGPIGTIFNPTRDNDWNYFTMRQDMDLKLIQVEDPEKENRMFRLVALPAGWKEPFEVQDKLIGNPRNPHEFNPVGRTDDLIVLSTGEKVFPAVLEGLLTESNLIKAAIAFGDGRFELGVIVESNVSLSPDEYEHFKSKIWPIIIEAGNKMDNHAQISSKDSIIIVPNGKKIPRSDKGSILRRDAVALFDVEIEEVYALLDDPLARIELPSLDINQLEQGIKNLIQTNLPWKWAENEWSYPDDLFELGMDSLQATRLRRLLLSSIPTSYPSLIEKIGVDFVYRYPSINRMAKKLRGGDPKDSDSTSQKSLLQSYVAQYSVRVPEVRSKTVVLLTGSTGSLGSHLLAYVSSLPDVAEVICLNRQHHTDARTRQNQAASSKGIQIPKEAWQKISVFQTHTSAPLLGLQDAEYESLRDKVTHIIHNAWTMDFKRSLPSFESHFRTLQNLCNLALDANTVHPGIKPRILFVSSIAVVGKYNLIYKTPEVPEVEIEDEACTNDFGYGHAKLVCERILETMSNNHRGQIEAGIVRVGQISGSTITGFWNTNEHFPALIKSSQFIGRFPKIKGLISWLPVDYAAKSMSQLLLTPNSYEKCMFFHLQNPVMQPAEEVLDAIISELGTTCSLSDSFEEWIEAVCDSNGVEDDVVGKENKKRVDSNPAKKLEGFFRDDFRRMGEVVMDTTQARRFSPALASMESVSADVIRRYVDAWRQDGFLQ